MMIYYKLSFTIEGIQPTSVTGSLCSSVISIMAMSDLVFFINVNQKINNSIGTL